jgi:lysophospholipase L1-like esterase
MGIELPARDGLGNNYGASGNYADYYKMMQYVHNLDSWYDEIASNNSNVYHINISGQFDTEFNMRTATRAVNIRNSTIETYQSNGVHPANSGYMQIADAAWRNMVHIVKRY